MYLEDDRHVSRSGTLPNLALRCQATRHSREPCDDRDAPTYAEPTPQGHRSMHTQTTYSTLPVKHDAYQYNHYQEPDHDRHDKNWDVASVASTRSHRGSEHEMYGNLNEINMYRVLHKFTTVND